MFKDGIFNQMTYEDWVACVDPKIQGSWNLHKFLLGGMDFFVLLSSLCGVVGKETTANYAAGSSYMDALAAHRVRNGEKAISLDLGIMDEEGLLAENKDLMAKMKAPGTLIPIQSKQLHALLDYYCNPNLDLLNEAQCQLAVGIELPANVRAKGLDPAPWMYQPALNHLFQIVGSEVSASGGDALTDFVSLFATSSSQVKAGAIVTEALMNKLSTSIAIAREDMDADKPMYQYGVDSLVAVELRNWFGKKLGADVAIFDLLGETTFRSIGVLAAGRSLYKQEAWENPA